MAGKTFLTQELLTSRALRRDSSQAMSRAESTRRLRAKWCECKDGGIGHARLEHNVSIEALLHDTMILNALCAEQVVTAIDSERLASRA
jgi:hypothetical protein